jgi:hypothetical protein
VGAGLYRAPTQIYIPPTAAPIEVKSAFGGLAIYKTRFLKGARCGYSERGVPDCEHVSLHREIRNRGGRLFILPSLRNSTQYEHVQRPQDFYYWSIRIREVLSWKVLEGREKGFIGWAARL